MAGVESVINKFVSDTLDKIIGGAKTVSEAIGITSGDLIGNVAIVGVNVAGIKGEIENLIKGIKNI
ncbi:variable large family protein [Borrelia persica]|uniref:variable large family protein n=1 Tax=Borrelia persica TaxID=44448 RepID=UPI000463474C